jgi:hypothetical protein
MRVIAYTYLIRNKTSNKWYYGVKYDKNCDTDSIGKYYFSSSKSLKDLIRVEGVENFTFEVRKIFNSVEKAKIWEHRFLKRCDVTNNESSYNRTDRLGPPIMRGNSNSSKRHDVRLKLSLSAKNRQPHSKEIIEKIKRTKIIKRIIELVRRKTFSQNIKCIEKYITFSKTNGHKIIEKRLQNILENLKNKKLAAKKDCAAKRGQNISDAKLKNKAKWYSSPDFSEFKCISYGELIPEGWVSGLKDTCRNQKISNTSSGRLHSSETKKLMSELGQRKIYCTSPDLQNLIVVYNETDIPEGWLRGNKLKSRNKKISEYTKTRHEKNKENNIIGNSESL